MKYVVGWNLEQSGTFGKQFYRDTRNEKELWNGWSDILVATTLDHATQYDTIQEAQDWNKEFLSGKGTLYTSDGQLAEMA